jgi:hypothetical protein
VDKIGSSYIALPDLIICGVAIVLYYCLTIFPPNSLIARVLALVCGFVIVSIILVIPLAENLTSDGIRELSVIAIGLAYGLLDWNRARAKSKLTPVSPPECQSS